MSRPELRIGECRHFLSVPPCDIEALE